jgi:rSAM/selenodomain-associated transferase 2
LSISIIIPVHNEEQGIGPCLDHLLSYPALEILVVDGGSTDQTLDRIRQKGLTPLISKPGRGTQQSRGAEAAAGSTLLFLHCDTRLPPDFSAIVTDTLQRRDVAAGAFQFTLNGQGWGYRLIERGANFRSRCLGMPYGDQALFMKKEMYLAAGGFAEQPVMEDVELVCSLKKLGRIVTVREPAVTSARRWQQQGLVKTTLINQLMMAGRTMGISPQRLARWYYGIDKNS